MFARLPTLPRIPLPSLFRNAATAGAAPLQQARGMARKKVVKVKDSRVRLIRYYLYHPSQHTPRPLKFGTMRMLRHWTIHRAWQLFKRDERIARQKSLEGQYNKIRDAVEELAKTDARLYRTALERKGLESFPITMRIPTDTPGVKGWNYGWKKA